MSPGTADGGPLTRSAQRQDGAAGRALAGDRAYVGPMTPALHTVRSGRGEPLVLVPALGGTPRSWDLVVPGLAAHREVVAVDLPGFGRTPPLEGRMSVERLADALVDHLRAEGLEGADLVGSSLGGRLVLELARRGVGRHVVALDPGGFWTPAQAAFLGTSLGASVALVRAVQPALPRLVGRPVGRTALLAQVSARPWALPGDLMVDELSGYTAPGMYPVLHELVTGPTQRGPATTPGRVVIGWGRQDRVTRPDQAARAVAQFPGAWLHWFDRCGHFPIWDRPAETVRLVLEAVEKPRGETHRSRTTGYASGVHDPTSTGGSSDGYRRDRIR